jgi:hypothetical protein
MNLRRRKSRRARAADKLRGVVGRRRKSKPARAAGALGDKVKRTGPGKTAQGAGMAGRAAGRHTKAVAAYASRKARGKRAPLLVTLPLFAGASIGGFMAARKMRQGVKQTVPE